MGHTACTEPQCLYKGVLYLYIFGQKRSLTDDKDGGTRNYPSLYPPPGTLACVNKPKVLVSRISCIVISIHVRRMARELEGV